ncbi:hypothetical protein DV735_g2789, partial [Chaetothyriales sp. CBS 134920]
MPSTSVPPQGPSNPHHRKIELQSPLDLTYLQANLWQCAQEKAKLHTGAAAAGAPTSAKPAEFILLGGSSGSGGSEEKQAREKKEQSDAVHALVSAFLSATWANALPSISINGLDNHQREEIEGVDYRYAAFDGKLQQRVASLYAEVEALTAQVSRLRREAPTRGAAAYAEAVRGVMDEDDDLWRRRRQVEDEEEQQQNQVGLQLEQVRSGWHEDVQSMYERGVDDLVRLAGLKRSDGDGRGGSSDASLTETVGKVQRARSVAMEFE